MWEVRTFSPPSFEWPGPPPRGLPLGDFARLTVVDDSRAVRSDALCDWPLCVIRGRQPALSVTFAHL